MNDLDLMLLADGESSANPADRSGASAGNRAKIEGIREVGELVRGHLELSADDADERLAGLWSLLDRRLDAEVPAEEPIKAVAVKASADRAGRRASLWGTLTGWMGEHRSHVATGFVAAGAAAVIAILARPPGTVTRTVIKEVPIAQVGPGTGTGAVVLVKAEATAAEVESLDVSGGTGAVFTIEADDDDSETTVIWVTPDDVGEDL